VAKILQCASDKIVQVVGSIADRPVIVVISDDPDLRDDFAHRHELHELERLSVQIKAEEAVRELARVGQESRLIRFVEGTASLDGCRLDHPLAIVGLEVSGSDVVIVAPIIWCTRDEGFYVRSAGHFVHAIRLGLPLEMAV
jgi:hypothetical protein